MFKSVIASVLLVLSASTAFANAIDSGSAIEEYGINKNEAYRVYDRKTGDVVEDVVFGPVVINTYDVYLKKNVTFTETVVCNREMCAAWQLEGGFDRYIFEKLDPENIIF